MSPVFSGATTGGNGGSRLRVGAPGKGASRADSNVFFILFNYKILSRFVAANDTAL